MKEDGKPRDATETAIPNTKEFRLACQMLTRLGVTINYAGFYQTAYALARAARDPGQLQLLSKWLYPETALQYHTGPSCVERNIRKVRLLVWKQGRSVLFEMIGHPLARMPGNARFLSYLTTCLLAEMEPPAKDGERF